MRTSFTRLFLFAGLGAMLVGAEAKASITLANITGPGTASVRYEGSVDYINPPSANLNLLGAIVDKTFNGIGTIAFDVNYDSIHFGNIGAGLRWTEAVTNNTGSALYSIVLTLPSAGSIFFTDTVPPNPPILSPTFVTAITDDGFGVIDGTDPEVHTDTADLLGTSAVSLDRKTLTFTFAAPLLPGATTLFHAPIEGLANAPGSFVLTQTVATPEAATIFVWSGLTAVGLGLGYIKRRRVASNA